MKKTPPPRQLDISIGRHFTQRFIERWGKQPDIISYLNEKLNEGVVVGDVLGRGLYFPSAGVYVPIGRDNFAITFQFRTMKTHQYVTTIKWSNHNEQNR